MTGIGSREHLELAGNACWFAKIDWPLSRLWCHSEICIECLQGVAM